jgi:hypothetical protein
MGYLPVQDPKVPLYPNVIPYRFYLCIVLSYRQPYVIPYVIPRVSPYYLS